MSCWRSQSPPGLRPIFTPFHLVLADPFVGPISGLRRHISLPFFPPRIMICQGHGTRLSGHTTSPNLHGFTRGDHAACRDETRPGLPYHNRLQATISRGAEAITHAHDTTRPFPDQSRHTLVHKVSLDTEPHSLVSLGAAFTSGETPRTSRKPAQRVPQIWAKLSKAKLSKLINQGGERQV